MPRPKLKVSKPGMDKLKKLYDDQCGPCMLSYPDCGGDRKKAKKWRCPKFFSGFFIANVEKGD